ncbi:putative suppressor protein SRP40-like isoform X2 [Capsicum annuum]|nr:putative suppressor protein SRP40-like isoform X2 [Capsicum annuum]
MSPPSNRTPATSPNIVDNVADDNQIWIVPERDGFDPHKVVIDGIANCIWSKFELARPSWKKFLESTRKMWFEELKNEFERKKQEILATQSTSAVDGETNSTSYPTQLSEIDIWMQSVGGKKKGKFKGLGSLGRSVKATNSSTSTLPKEIDEMIKFQVDASNAHLYAQLQNERKKNKRMRKELHMLMKHVYNKSSSNDELHLKKTTKLMRMKVMMTLMT